MTLKQPLKIIVVEDFTSLREQMVIYLQSDGHTVHGADSGIELDELLNGGFVPDILILDLNLPIEDGNSIAARMRQAFPVVGIIMHTVRVSSSEKVKGYANGADLYVSKPACPEEISAAVFSLARRLYPTNPSKNWILDVNYMKLTTPNNQSISLTSTEVLVLKNLAVSNDSFIDHLGLLSILNNQNQSSTKFNIEVLLSRLRKKIKVHFGNETFIKAVRGRGYKLCLPIEVHNNGSAPKHEITPS